MGRSIGAPKGGDSRTQAPPAWLEAGAHGFALALHVQPGARRTAVVGPYGSRLKVAVAAPPTDGRANDAVVAFIAARLGVPRSRIRLLAGAGSREKRVAIDTELPLAAVIEALRPAAEQ